MQCRVSHEGYFGVYFPSFFGTHEINTKTRCREPINSSPFHALHYTLFINSMFGIISTPNKQDFAMNCFTLSPVAWHRFLCTQTCLASKWLNWFRRDLIATKTPLIRWESGTLIPWFLGNEYRHDHDLLKMGLSKLTFHWCLSCYQHWAKYMYLTNRTTDSYPSMTYHIITMKSLLHPLMADFTPHLSLLLKCFIVVCWLWTHSLWQ